MTLIPTLLSALIPAPSAPPTGDGGSLLMRGSYNPGARHRPVAAALAFGLPAALVVAVALSPMVTTKAPVLDPTEVIQIELQKPPPPPPPIDSQLPPPATPLTATKPLFTPPLDTPFELPPTPLDPPPIRFTQPADPGPPPAQLAEPKLVLAVVDPRYAGLFQPDYPAFEQRNDMEGVVKVRVLIGTDGRVKAVEQVSSASPGFFAETRQRALAKWRFKPATRDGVPYESWQVMTVRFEMKNA